MKNRSVETCYICHDPIEIGQGEATRESRRTAFSWRYKHSGCKETTHDKQSKLAKAPKIRKQTI